MYCCQRAFLLYKNARFWLILRKNGEKINFFLGERLRYSYFLEKLISRYSYSNSLNKIQFCFGRTKKSDISRFSDIQTSDISRSYCTLLDWLDFIVICSKAKNSLKALCWFSLPWNRKIQLTSHVQLDQSTILLSKYLIIVDPRLYLFWFFPAPWLY